jgi:two-component system chemotaxis response regulator CheB
MSKTKVLIVDDSAVVRRMLTEILESSPDLQVVGDAPDPFRARELIKQLNPDVITLDVEMPKMDGLTFLSNLMRLRPMPVVMISSLTESGAAVTLDALALGAVDFVAKPKMDLVHGLEAAAEEIVRKVRVAARARPRSTTPSPAVSMPKPATTAGRKFKTTDQIIAIGASTGGTEAIRELLTVFPPDAPGTVITQHIPPAYSRAFAERLDKSCSMRVFHAEHNQRILPGHAYVAPGGVHIAVKRSGAHWICRLLDTEPVNRHKPSVDVLFESVSQSAGENAIGVLLTGMGDDGARGLKSLRAGGAFTVVQDEASSVVWGMPGAAFRLGAAAEVLPLEKIGERVLKEAERKSPLSSLHFLGA